MIKASQNPFTCKPAVIRPSLFLGVYANLAALQTEHATAQPGNWAIVQIEDGPDLIFIWDTTENQWVTQSVSFNQNNKIREVFIGFANNRTERNALLNSTNMVVADDENVIITYFTPFNQQGGYVQASMLWKLGKGEYAPIGADDFGDKFFELPIVYPSEDSIDQLITAPEAVVRDYGTFTGTILEEINTNAPVDFDDETKVYYIRATKDDITYLWRFNGTNGTYGTGELQMDAEDIELLFSSETSGAVFDPSSIDLAEFLNASDNPFVRVDGLPGIPNIQGVLAVGNYDGVHGFGSREYVGSFTEDPNSDEPYRCAAFLNDSILFGDFDPLGVFKDIYIFPIYESGKLSIFSNYTNGINDGTIATEEWVQANVSGGAVESVNGQTGDVVLDADDVGAEPALGFTPENVSNKATDLTSPDNTKYPTTQAVVNGLSLKTLPLIADDTTAVITGVTVPTAFRSYLIPAGTLTNYNRLIMQMQVRKDAGTGTGSIRFYINTSNNFATATQIATANMTSGISYGDLSRKFILRGTNLLGFNFTTNSATDSQVNAAAFDITAFNRANDIWVFLAANPASTTEVYTLEYFEMNARRTKTTI
jgi:hypothetical protein